LTALAAAVAAIEPQVIVEIGTRDGGTLLVWSRTSPALRQLISIDLPGGIHGGGYPAQRERFYHLFAHDQPALHLNLLRRDSQTATTRDAVIAALGEQPIDFLFIDGDHRYPGVSRDYALYAPLVRPGGLIAFHDIRPNRFDESIEVWRLWDEIKASGAPVREFIHAPYSGRYGIGVVEKR
jgi:predicted O-methyltransferase YrrM